MPTENDKRKQNRADFPQTAAWLDALRAKFGPGCKVEYASEGGREVGREVEAALTQENMWSGR